MVSHNKSEFFLLKPRNAARGNGTVLYEVSNRGNKGILSFFNRASGSRDPADEAHFGDGFLLDEGFTLLRLGWQFDVPEEPGRIADWPIRNITPMLSH